MSDSGITVTKAGTVTITEEGATFSNFKLDCGGVQRTEKEVSNAAIRWAIQQLTKELDTEAVFIDCTAYPDPLLK